MPFTLSHAAAAIPFRRSHLIPSALVIGTFAPDFEYFLRLSPDDRFGHTLVGTFLLTLPVALAVLWLFHRVVKAPLVQLLPQTLERRLQPYLAEFRFTPATRFLLILASLLVGIATHLLWDSFTHRNTWIYERWPSLQESYRLPLLGPRPLYKILQHGSTIFGILVLLIWLVWWYRRSEPTSRQSESLSPRRKLIIVTFLIGIASIGAVVRAVAGSEVRPLGVKQLVGEAIVTLIALMWWELVAYGIASNRGSRADAESS